MTARRDASAKDPVGGMAGVLRRMASAELELARFEMAASLRRAVLGLMLLAVSLLLVLVALNMLAGAAAIALADAGVPDRWAPALVGIALIAIAGGMSLWSLRALKPSKLFPVRAAARLRHDAELIKEMMRHEP